ncbi:hypothetical protein PFJ87_03g01420 [Encephalitozoon hellem]|uniref:Uncharacterized protein n=1 Tax=Encephalitozoon hellem TaxID=27973 RepID=A0ABY8CHD0_ENCHE|nr:hypothetical protein PFJ87_03g01420 [Encephalitozoon hellem]
MNSPAKLCDEHNESRIQPKARNSSGVFWTLFWVLITCIVIIVLSIDIELIYEGSTRTSPTDEYIPFFLKKALRFFIKMYMKTQSYSTIFATFLDAKRRFCVGCGLLIFINVTLGLFLASFFNTLTLRFKSIDFWRIVMTAIRIYILLISLRGKNMKRVGSLLDSNDTSNLLAAQYCLSCSWELFREIESNTSVDIIVRVIGYWIITSTISKEVLEAMERALRHPSKYIMNKAMRTKPGNSFKYIANKINSILSKEGFIEENFLLRIISYFLSKIFTPSLCVFMAYFFLKIIERFECMVYKELEIPQRFIRLYTKVVSAMFILLFLLYAYYEISTMVKSIEQKSILEGSFPGGYMLNTAQPGTWEFLDNID